MFCAGTLIAPALSVAVSFFGGGDPGFVLNNPPTVEIGNKVTFQLLAPFDALTIFFVSLGDGPTNTPWGSMCLDFPALVQFPFFISGGTPVNLTASVPCDDSFIGVKVFEQFVSFNIADKTQIGISNGTSLEIIAPSGTSGSFADFSDVSALQLNGTAAQAGSVLRLTPDLTGQAGTTFYKSSFPVDAETSFSTRFQFRIHGASGGADGMTLMIQGNDEFVVGIGGSGLGYGGIGSSVAIEIDNWISGMFDPNGNHLGILLNGDYTHSVGLYVPPFDLEDGASHTMWVDYCGQNNKLEVFLAEATGGSKPDKPVMTKVLDLFAIVGNTGFIGFSAATGAVTNNHDVENWDFVVW